MSNAVPEFARLTPMIPGGKDIRATVDFYEQKLGFTTTYKADDFNTVIIQRGDVEMMLTDFDDPHTASQTSLRILVTGVDTLYQEYQAQSIAPFHENKGAGLGAVRVTPWGTREFAVRDLAGVCITFYERLAR